MVGDERSGSVQLPGGGAAWKTPGKVFELAIQGDSGGISVIDVKAMRETT